MHKPKWRNWQTRYVQGVVLFGECGFDSHLRHLQELDWLVEFLAFLRLHTVLRAIFRLTANLDASGVCCTLAIGVIVLAAACRESGDFMD